ncbi:hypothetical protein CGRA01v4_08537 [Colletotrichum graminicola]|nr:hypothetical protein CGRA01v4_08537 [Colletotrichum graminicola]
MLASPIFSLPFPELSECWIWASGGRTCPSTRLSLYRYLTSLHLHSDRVPISSYLSPHSCWSQPLPIFSHGLFLGA